MAGLLRLRRKGQIKGWMFSIVSLPFIWVTFISPYQIRSKGYTCQFSSFIFLGFWMQNLDISRASLAQKFFSFYHISQFLKQFRKILFSFPTLEESTMKFVKQRLTEKQVSINWHPISWYANLCPRLYLIMQYVQTEKSEPAHATVLIETVS